jgi:hypothetical protein
MRAIRCGFHALCGLLIWSSLALAQTIGGATPIPLPVQNSDLIFIFRGSAPVYSATVAQLLAGLNTGVFGPASSTNGYIPQWNGVAGNLLSAGLPVGATGANTILELNGSGLISTSILPSTVTLKGNSTVGSGSIVLATSTSTTVAGQTCSLGGACRIAAVNLTNGVSGSGAIVLATGATLTNPTLVNVALTNAVLTTPTLISPTVNGALSMVAGTIQYPNLPTGSPKTYACFDVTGRLISFWTRCAP